MKNLMKFIFNSKNIFKNNKKSQIERFVAIIGTILAGALIVYVVYKGIGRYVYT